MMSYETYNGTLYKYTAGVYCGVFMKQRTMKKLCAMQAKYLEDVKRLLSDANDNGEIFPEAWTLHHPDEKQTTVQFIDSTAKAEDRIKIALVSAQPIACSPVFIAPSMTEAARMADERFEEINDA